MKLSSSLTFIALIALCGLCSGKGGRGGGFSRGSSSRGSSSRGSSGGGWSLFGSSKPASRPSPSYSSPSYSKPAPSYSNPPAYGWNANSPSASRPSGNQNVGWNVGNSPQGPPPAYPGLANRPVSNQYSPPAYSPSYSKPPAYNPSYSPNNNYNRQHNYNTHSSYPSYNAYPNYGSTFGSGGLPGNTYISNNYYGGSRSGGGSSFLTNALFYGAGMHHGHMWGSSSSRRSWDSEEDRRWRATTKAPYFENKVPGSESFLPAAAVVGAATAFGLASLLPLNVPANKPLMYCNSTDIAQAQIKLEEKTYWCVNNSIAMSCPSVYGTGVTDDCLNKTMACDLQDSDDGIKPELYCTNGTLISRSGTVCNSTTVVNGTNVNETTTILSCYPGMLAEKLTAFIPTTTTEAPATTERQLSFGARVHIFFLDLIGKSDVLEKPPTTTTTEAYHDFPRLELKENETAWAPEALTMPPETTTTEATTTTTTEAPYYLAWKMPKHQDDGSILFLYEKVGDPLASTIMQASKMFGGDGTLPDSYHKFPMTTNLEDLNLKIRNEAKAMATTLKTIEEDDDQ